MNKEYFTIKLAEINIGINPRSSHMRSFCKSYICDEEADFVVSASDKDIEEERKRMIDYTGRANASEQELEQLYIYRQIAENIPKYGVFLMHATALCVDDKAYLLAGPSGAGKTTHAKLWEKVFKDRMYVINDDKPLLRIKDNSIIVYSSPWSGKEKWHNNVSALLKAVIFVNQAKDNHIETMKRDESWNKMMNQIYRSPNADNMKRTLKFIDTTINMIPIYSLYCNKNQEAVMVGYEVVSK